jgi:hypothetical protein
MAGVDLYTVQRAGGWKTQVMVQRYAHLSPDHMRTAVERLAIISECGTGTKTGTYAEDGDGREGAKSLKANGGGGRTRTSDTGLMRHARRNRNASNQRSWRDIFPRRLGSAWLELAPNRMAAGITVGMTGGSSLSALKQPEQP